MTVRLSETVCSALTSERSVRSAREMQHFRQWDREEAPRGRQRGHPPLASRGYKISVGLNPDCTTVALPSMLAWT